MSGIGDFLHPETLLHHQQQVTLLMWQHLLTYPGVTPSTSVDQRHSLSSTSAENSTMFIACRRSIRSISAAFTVKKKSSSNMQPDGQSPHACRKTTCQIPYDFDASISELSSWNMFGSANSIPLIIEYALLAA